MSYRHLRITAADRRWHGAFFDHVAQVFRGIDFRRWGALGGWTVDYDVLALVEADRILATVGRTRMPVIVNGRERIGLQLGAVATRVSHRRRGLARELMEQALSGLDAPDTPVFLFANPDVLDFYPRFGFRRVMQSRFGARAAFGPSAFGARPFKPDSAAERARLADLCARALPTGRRFGSRACYPILLWHLCNRPLAAHWLDAGDAFAVAGMDGDRLILHDVIAARPFDLRAAISALVTGPIAAIEFGFEPDEWWPDAKPLGPDDALLFVRGAADLPAGPIRFPDLAQT